MKTILLSDDAVFKGNLILINQQYAYHANKFKKLPVSFDNKKSNILLERQAAIMLKHIIKEINGEEKIVAVSGWRQKLEQEHIYQASLLANGITFTEQYVALPNHSEHQTGLAIDLGEKLPLIDFLRPHFPYMGICDIFRKTSVSFGFIERYSHGKENITYIAHEPWHFRYVGTPHAEIIYHYGLCLEEYLTFLKERTTLLNPYEHKLNGYTVKIFYTQANTGKKTKLVLPDDAPYTISGDNMQGFIITVWRKQK